MLTSPIPGSGLRHQQPFVARQPCRRSLPALRRWGLRPPCSLNDPTKFNSSSSSSSNSPGDAGPVQIFSFIDSATEATPRQPPAYPRFLPRQPEADASSSNQAPRSPQQPSKPSPSPGGQEWTPSSLVPAAPSSSSSSGSGAPGGGQGYGYGLGSAYPMGPPPGGSYSEFYKAQNVRPHVDASTQTPLQATSQQQAEPAASSDGAAAGAAQGPQAQAQGSSAAPGQTGDASVAQALARAQEALTKVESSLDDIDRLPSAQPPSQMAKALVIAKNVIIVGALTVGLVASHAFGLVVQWLCAVAGAVGIAWWGYTRRSLNTSGALAALVVGAATLGCSLRFGATLLAFFFSSSKLTQYKGELKEGLDDQAKKGGQRDWKQVFCNGLVPTVLAVAYGVLAGCVDVPLGPSPQVEAWRAQLITALAGGFLGYYACCCGDTWASELGPLSSDTPRLITTLRPVRRGTNGGVTLLGLSASILGGMFVGTAFYAAAVLSPTLWIWEAQRALAVSQWRLIPLGLMAGLVGSVIDSLLGATLQFTGYDPTTGRITSKPGPGVVHISGTPFLDNNMVNALSASLTAGLTALATLKVFGM